MKPILLPRILTALLAGGLWLAACSQQGALHSAANKGDVEKVKTLLAEGARVDLKDSLGSTPLHLAVRSGHQEIAEMLLDRGAPINAQDSAGNTPLHTSVQMGRPELTRLLVEHGATVDATEGIWGRTALHFVAQLGPAPSADLLIRHGANVHARDALGDTPLHYAALSNRVEIARLLLEKGADPNLPAQDPFTRAPGTTPLMLAKEKEMTQLLRQYGAG